MRRLGACAALSGGLLAATALPVDAAQEARAQSIAAGARVYGAKGCGGCHAINGVGGTIAPDLGHLPAPTLNALIAAMWNHLPGMAARMRSSGTAVPRLSPWEADDLMAFLFWAASDRPPGNAAAGQRLFADKFCIVCHQVGNVGGVLGPRLDGLASRTSGVELAAALWNHAGGMEAELRTRGLPRPTLSGTNLDDLVAYFGAASGYLERRVHALPGRAVQGERLFREKSCIRCHRAGSEGGAIGPDLMTGARRDPSAFAAAMWNKGPGMMRAMQAARVDIPTLSGGDMADLVAYLGSLQYFVGAGRASRGAEAAGAGGCLRCHSVQGRGAGRAGDLGRMTAIRERAAVIAALWNHVAVSPDELAAGWRELRPAQVADLVAFFELQGRRQ